MKGLIHFPFCVVSVVLLINCQPKQEIDSELIGMVFSVSDGDTFTFFTSDYQELKIRLQGIDAPEHDQEFAQDSRETLKRLILKKEVRLETFGKDRYNRVLAYVFLDDLNINYEMIRLGMAWHYVQYSEDSKMKELEKKARKEKIGLWNSSESIPPWQWRKKITN